MVADQHSTDAGPGAVLLRVDGGGVARLTLNRPAKRNALDIATFAALEEQLSDIAARPDDIGVVVLGGAGRDFSAGADISGPTRAPRRNFQASVIEQLATSPSPSIARIRASSRFSMM